MRLIYLLSFLISSKNFAFSISFWNLQNFYGASGQINLEYTPINHPKKKIFCQRNKKGWERKNCLYTHWTEEKVQRRSELFQAEIASFPESDLWCFVEVESADLVRSLHNIKEERIILGLDQNPRGQNIFCSLSKKIKPNLVSSRAVYLAYNKRLALEICLRFEQQYVYFIVVHLPSQFHQGSERQEALNKILSMYGGKKFILLGDFNMRSSEFARLSSFKFKWHKTNLQGTYYYQRGKRFEHFDQFFGNVKNGKARILLPLKHAFTKGQVIPKKFSRQKEEGLSDHFPVRLELINFR